MSKFDCCTCIKDRKIPYQEQDFLKDQRTARKMIISKALDKESSLKTRRILDRRAKEQARYLLQQIEFQDETMSISSTSESNYDSSSTDFESNLPSYVIKKKGKTEVKNIQRNVSLENFAIACDRVGVSNRAAATIASAVIDDLAIDNQSQVIDKNKVMRERTKLRNEAIASVDFSNIRSIYFDGRKDLTLKFKASNNKKVKTEVTEEHVTLI